MAIFEPIRLSRSRPIRNIMLNKVAPRTRPMEPAGLHRIAPGARASPSPEGCAIRRVHSPGGAVGVPASREHRFDALRLRFEACGQGAVFRFWDRLGNDGRERLLAQAESIDLPALLRALAARRERPVAPPQ